ncbi:MAG: tRNA lysidine(34) synthetase TilS [Paludibacter sp.]|nr:tRNA lysidine(34) synthetase TilS [Paludibacter sp.]
MQKKVQDYIKKHDLLSSGTKVIVGVSGGTDSVVLLHILHNLGYDCIVAHCNFHLRMDDSKRDEEFVRNLATSMKIKYYSIEFKTFEYAKEHKISVEMAARELRYAWFNQLFEKQGAQAIAVAHHADDNIETMLMNLVRGTGIRGLSGIPYRNGQVVRPLLCCSRTEIENYMIENNLDHVEDTTNANSDYTRNKFRNEVLPLLEEINPSVRQTLYNTIERFEGIQTIYEQSLYRINREVVHITDDGLKIDIEILKKQPHIPIVLYEILFPLGFHPAVIKQVEKHLDSEPGRTFYSPSHRLLKDRKYLIINANIELSNTTFTISHEIMEIFQPIHLKFSRRDRHPELQISKEANCIHIDADVLQFPLTLRRWNKGDTFYPFGMQKHKKLSDFFIDEKMSRIDKEQCWILLSGDEIVWIVGKRIDNRFRVTEDTKIIFQVELEFVK